MVVTRRAAKAMAEAQAAAEREQLNNDSVESEVDEVDAPKLEAQQRHRRSSIAWRLWMGHCIAILTVSILIHAALQPPGNALPFHAVALLLCAVPFRTVLAFSVHALRTPNTRQGIFLALSAASLFASNALHVLATRSFPQHILTLMAAAALDITAAWLKMTVSAKHPSVEPFILPFSMVYTAADIYLAAVIAKQTSFVELFVWFMALRFIINFVVVITCSMTILGYDDLNKKAVKQTPS